MGIGAYFPGVKQPKREAERALPSAAEIKNHYYKYFHNVVL
jgi:hypothetical protein